MPDKKKCDRFASVFSFVPSFSVSSYFWLAELGVQSGIVKRVRADMSDDYLPVIGSQQ